MVKHRWYGEALGCAQGGALGLLSGRPLAREAGAWRSIRLLALGGGSRGHRGGPQFKNAAGVQ
ncbi:hypothetical protein ABU162_24385 [Paenibacillus thiaminolyticus]|uniref:hypothetical protein n=1 Tax=Paenibacillus thiaminolyticus TaxID=49283 RepID=UPI0035A6FDD0